MAHGHKFDVKKLDRLRDPDRLQSQNPEAIWSIVGGGQMRVVVDIGAGLGFFAIPFSRHLPQGRVIACDISAEMLSHLRDVLREEGVSNVEPLQSAEVAIPLPDGEADLVFMANLHHELDHPEASLAECRRLLRPGGRLAIVDWKPQETPTGPPAHIRIPEATVRRQLEAAGFADVQSSPILPYHYLLTATKP